MLSANATQMPAEAATAKYAKLLEILSAFENELHCSLWYTVVVLFWMTRCV